MIVSNFDDFKDQSILIVGAGSIGKRHLKNLYSLGYKNLFVFRHNSNEKLIIDNIEFPVINDWKTLKKNQFFAIFICTPTVFHLDQALNSLKLNAHVFIEKPLASSIKGLSKFKKIISKTEKTVFIAYMLRFHPLIMKIKGFVEAGDFGNLISFTTKWGEYLPNWHPWEDYSASYASRNDLGGGVALTLSHDIDIVNWITGSPLVKSYHIKNFRSSLKIDVEGGIDILYQYENGVTGHSHLNYYSKNNERYMEFIFESANVRFDYYNSTLTIDAQGLRETQKAENFDRNQLFVDELNFFFEKCSNNSLQESLEAINESELIINICNNDEWNREGN
jgi:predicted dehydrogenase